MKVITCPNCHKNFAESYNTCPFCKTDLTNFSNQSIEPQSHTSQTDTQQEASTLNDVLVKPKKNKKPIIIIVIAVVIIAVIALIFIIANNTYQLSDYGETTVRYARRLKNSLKAPNSLEFYSDVIYIKAQVNEQEVEYCYFDYTAENSYGTAVRDEVVYIDGELYDLDLVIGGTPNRFDYKNEYGVIDEARWQADVEIYKKVRSAEKAVTICGILESFSEVTIIDYEIFPAEKIEDLI